MMTTFWAVTRTEIRLTWRRRSFWIVQGLVLFSALKLALVNVPDRIVLGLVSSEVSSLLLMELLFLPLLVGPATTRDLGAAGEMLWVAPLDALTHVAGVSAGLWLALLPALVVQVGARWLIAYLVHSLGAPSFWVFGLPPLLISASAGLGLVMSLAILLRRTLSLFLVWGALLSGALAWAKMTSLLNLGFSSLQLSPALGLGLYRPLVYGLSVWFVGVGLMALPFVLGGVLLADRRRATRYVVPWLLWVLVAGLILGSGYTWHARAAAAQAAPTSPVDVQLDAWTVRAHTLQATVDVEQGAVEGASTLLLEPSSATATADHVVLRFNPGLALRDAYDAAGEPLTALRQGDSLVVSLPTSPTAPFTLCLSWEGAPRLPYVDYWATWKWAKQPARVLLTGGVGYLLREGDWYPWPWTTGPHQAGRSRVTLQVTDERALASAPLHDGTATWEGLLPPALLAIPPADEYALDGITLHVGGLPILAGPRLLERLETFAPAVLTLTRALGEAVTPTHIVAAPYLTDFVWSGDLVLVPEGSGYLDWDGVEQAYWRGPTPGVEERAVLTALARSWLSAYLSPPRRLVRALPNGKMCGADDPRGRWLEEKPVAVSDGSGVGARVRLTPSKYLDVLALWIALELADPAVREADLELFQNTITSDNIGQLHGYERERLLPAGLIPGHREGPAILLALHEWATVVGPGRALRLVGDVVRSGAPFDLARLLADLERASGISVNLSTD
jgi:hypothetical protein